MPHAITPHPTPRTPQGIYVLQDHSFRWLLRVSPTTTLSPAASDAAKEEFRRAVHSQLYLPCGIVRGGSRGRGRGRGLSDLGAGAQPAAAALRHRGGVGAGAVRRR
jgi:hypothetical protein